MKRVNDLILSKWKASGLFVYQRNSMEGGYKIRKKINCREMSACCSNYPSCDCFSKNSKSDSIPKLLVWVGDQFRELTKAEEQQLFNKRKSLKTNGKSEFVFIDNPDRIDDRGMIVKRRNRGTNFTPKKKKRK